MSQHPFNLVILTFQIATNRMTFMKAIIIQLTRQAWLWFRDSRHIVTASNANISLISKPNPNEIFYSYPLVGRVQIVR